MELDEMKQAWQELDQRVTRSEALGSSIRREMKLGEARSMLRHWAWLPSIELGVGIVTALVTGSFLGDSIKLISGEPLGAIPGAVLLLLAIATMTISIRQLTLIGGIDYASPVVTIQQRLLAVRALRIRMTQWNLLLGLPFWPVFVAFAMQCAFGYGSYRLFGLAWIGPIALFGLALMVLLIWVTRRYAASLSRSRILRKLSDEIAGRGLATAVNQLDELARFSRE